jgi:MFS family permease
LPYSGTRPFYGWIIVFVGFITQVVQGLVSQGFSTYADLLHTEFGWSKAVLAGPRSVTSVQGSILGPITGFLVDRFGPRIVVGSGVVVTGVGLILLGMTHSLWMYYFSNIIMALGLSLGGMLVMSVAVGNWFRRRGTLAQSVMLLGFSLAGVVGVPTLVFMQTSLGWHAAAMWTGVAVIAVGVPSTTLLRTRPEAYGLLPDGERPSAPGQADQGLQSDTEYSFTLAEAVRTRAFWLLALGWALNMLGIGVVQVHIFLHLGGDVGLSRTAAALVWSVASLSNIPSRLVGGIMGDRLPKKLTLAMAMALMGASIFALAVARSFSMALLFAVPYGIAWGMFTPVINSMQGEYFGRKSQGVIRGWLQLVGLPLSIVAPVLAGYAADRQGTYRGTFIVISAIMVAGAGIVFFATRPKPPGKQSQ